MIVYYNCELSGGRKDETMGQYRNVGTNVSLSSPLLQRQEDYNVSIIRCKIPLSLAMPLWITEFLTVKMIPPGSPAAWADGVNTPYWISLIPSTDIVSTSPTITTTPNNLDPFYIPFVRSNFQNESNLTLPLTSQPIDKRGFLYSYTTFANMINATLQDCVQQYNILAPLAIPPVPTIGTLTFKYDTSNQRFYFSSTAALPPNINLNISPSLVQYLNGFQIIQNTTYSHIPLILDTEFKLYQDWGPQFQAIQSIVITSSIFVLPEYSQKIIRPSPPQLNQFGVIQLQQDFDQILILQDFVFDGTQPNSFCTPLVYNSATVKYSREVTILGHGPLQYFSINVMWVDSNGLLRQMETNDTQSSSILLAFIPKI